MPVHLCCGCLGVRQHHPLVLVPLLWFIPPGHTQSLVTSPIRKATLSEARPYKRRKVRLSVSESEEHSVLGRQAVYAKVLFPQFQDGEQRDQPLAYLLVTSMRAAPLEGEDGAPHDAFLTIS